MSFSKQGGGGRCPAGFAVVEYMDRKGLEGVHLIRDLAGCVGDTPTTERAMWITLRLAGGLTA